ncbi:REP element-mobilizing transposase RayT [Zhouia amylolytica]|uniref:REP element-mobilizing transposase RayT n=1 Tax=Zhouia amylolytica TaxID=376730 RepID=A0A1I6RM27_9FLAO|nr:transposase [Zhouia amylolytica]SFS65767.1 REP element-mobilizing transposase RayT [Zhouia amylolytica]
MSRNYKFHNPEGLYFVSFAVVGWLDVFTRNEYKNILLDSLSFCQQNKGMEIIAWCIMSNHVHLVFRSINGEKPEQILGDFKRFTSKTVVEAIKDNFQESRKEFLLNEFKKAAKRSSNVKSYQFWRHDNKPIELWSNKVIKEKINYIHQNPVEAGLVFRPEDYVYSSAVDYAGEKGLIENVVVFKSYD